ncbi:MAG: RNA-binding protein [Candidatus Methanoplasma sp.]|jgi:translin|nr:RNA-binding protein [Candidatus Methanoplasma sp.]
MEDITKIADDALGIFRDLESRRERAIRCSRDILRETKRMIHSIHVSGDGIESKNRLMALVSDLMSESGIDKPRMNIAPVEDALMEYAEAMILDSIVRHWSVPSFDDLGIGPQPWVLGLADCLGEMRRVVLTSLMADDIVKAESVFMMMEEISLTIMLFDVPDAILPIRRKQDIARGIMERTRTDITNAIVLSKIRH